MNDGGGRRLTDAAGQANGSILGGAAWMPTTLGPALYFDGATGSYVECGDTAVLRNLGIAPAAFTLAAWVQSDRPSTNGQKYWSICNRGILANQGYGLAFYDRYEAGTQSFCVWTRGASYKECRANNVYKPLSGWNFVVGAFDGVNMRLYMNGALAATAAGTTPYATGYPNFRIGHDADTLPLPWLGRIAMVAAWNRVLHANEIARLYAEPFALFDDGGLPFAANWGSGPHRIAEAQAAGAGSVAGGAFSAGAAVGQDDHSGTTTGLCHG